MDLEQFKKDISNINHGTAISLYDHDELGIKIGDESLITAYLPEMEKFAIMHNNKLITFDCTEGDFTEYFKVTNSNF